MSLGPLYAILSPSQPVQVSCHVRTGEWLTARLRLHPRTDTTAMDTPHGDAAQLEELQITAGMIRQRTKRLYKDAEILWRLGAKLDDLVAQLNDTPRGHDDDH